MKFLQYAGGNPLALKVLGAALYQKTRDEWESALEKLEEYPEEDIFGPLKVSFDGLGCLERNMFLDIACLFNGEGGNKNDEINLLQGCYKGAQFGISNLVDKCLVDLRFGCPWMHDLLQEMGCDIVRQESEDPGKRSRLRSPEDVYRVLKNNKGTKSIKGISLNMSEIKALQICPAIFEKMVNLVFIRFYANSWKDIPCNKLLLANQDLKYLPNVLRYFGWDYCPLKSLPSNFDPRNLVELFLPNSNIEQLWDGEQEVVNLRVMDLSCCNNIRKIQNLSGATKLETLYCFECTSLVDLPCMTHLKSLKMLDLVDCPISKFPKIRTNLEELLLGGTQIEEVPSFIGSLKKLRHLNMSYTKFQNIPSNILKLDALIHFSLCGCPNITELNLNMTPPTEEELPSSSMPRFRRLIKLGVSYCKSLKSISGLPPWLAYLTAKDCTSLERLSFTADDYQNQVIHPFKGFEFNNCFNLNQEAHDNIIAACLMIKIQFRVKQLAKQLTKNELDVYDEKASHQVLCCLPGSEISDKFENQSRNSLITVKLAGSATSRRFLCFAVCLVLDFKHFREYEEHWYSIHSEYQLKGRDGVCQSFKRVWHRNSKKPNPMGCSSEHMFVLYRDDMVHRDMSYNEASFHFCVVRKYYHNKEELKVKVKVEKCGVHVFYVDAKSFSISEVGSSTNLSSDEDNKLCNSDNITPNFPVCPDWISSGGPLIEEDAHVDNGHGENPATAISKLDTKRGLNSDIEGDHEPEKRVKLSHSLRGDTSLIPNT